MRNLLAVSIVAALCAGSAVADEPAACYQSKDPSGEFVPAKLTSSDADAAMSARISHLMNRDNRGIEKCFKKFVAREGGWPNGAVLLFGARISHEGKPTQVSLLAAEKVNDAMLMACLGRAVCAWELPASADGQERLVMLPPFSMSGDRGYGGADSAAAPRAGLSRRPED
jgi:hypothetical protein